MYDIVTPTHESPTTTSSSTTITNNETPSSAVFIVAPIVVIILALALALLIAIIVIVMVLVALKKKRNSMKDNYFKGDSSHLKLSPLTGQVESPYSVQTTTDEPAGSNNVSGKYIII